MRKRLARILIALLCFGLGVGAASAVGMFERAYFSYEPLSVFEADHQDHIIACPILPSRRRFVATGRGCGPGYIQGYETEDGQGLSEGTALVTNGFGPGYRQRIRQSLTLQYVNRYRDHRGEIGERYILRNPPNEQGESSVTILFYSGGDFYRFIDAPTMVLALEFEQFLIATDYQESTK